MFFIFHFQTKELTKVFNEIAAPFSCKPVEGMLSHQLGHFRIDGEKTIIQNPTEKQRYGFILFSCAMTWRNT